MAEKALAPSNPVTTRDPKGRKFISIVETAYNNAGLTQEEAQSVNEARGLSDLIGNFIAKNRSSNRFKDESVKSNYGFLSGNGPGVMDINRQITKLQQLFPGLNDANPEYLEKIKIGMVQLPYYFTMWGAVPNWKNRPDLFGSIYNDGVQKILDKIQEILKSRFNNSLDGQIGPDYLRQSQRSIEFWDWLIQEQGNTDVILIPFQLGTGYAQHSINREREVFAESQFRLGLFATGCLLLTHPEHMYTCAIRDAQIDCAGDEYFCKFDGVFKSTPFFVSRSGKLMVRTSRVDNVDGYYGSASAYSAVKFDS